jgi:hypothetical protein
MPTVVGYVNYAKTGTLVASSATPELPASNLALDICAPSLGWQSEVGAVSGVTLRITAAGQSVIWRLFGLFRSNLSSTATVSVTVWRRLPDNSLAAVWTSGSIIGVARDIGQVVIVAPADTVGDYCVFDITDSLNPDRFINVGGVFAGPGWYPASGITWASSTGREADVRRTTTRGGQEYLRLKWSRRLWDVSFDGIRESELWGPVDALRVTSRRGSNVLFIPNTESAHLQNEAIFGLLADSANVGFPARSADRRSWRAVLTERL